MKSYAHPSRLSALTLLFALIAAILPSCSPDKADMSELLATVPADASAVATVNIRSLVEKAGCKIDGSKIVPGKEVEKLIADHAADSTANNIRSIFNGETGIDPSVAIAFLEGSDLYITGFLADPDTFKGYVQKETGENFRSEENVEISGNMAVKGNQFWIHANHRNDINPKEISRFASLSEKLSFLSNSYANHLTAPESDIEGWANLSSLYNVSGMSFQNKTLAGMGLAILYSDAQDIAFKANFENGRLATSLNILNSKGEPAKFNLPTDRIDIGMVKDLSKSADMIFAMAISPKMIEQIKKDLGEKSVPGADALFSALSAVDGTCVIAASDAGMKGVVSTKGEGTADLSNLLSSFTGATVTKDGKLLRFEKGEIAGKIENASVADNFKGCMFAVVVAPDTEIRPEFKNMEIRNVFSALVPNEGSVELTVTVNSFNEKENFLLTFLKGR